MLLRIHSYVRLPLWKGSYKLQTYTPRFSVILRTSLHQLCFNQLVICVLCDVNSRLEQPQRKESFKEL